MPAMEPLSSLIEINPKKFSKEEFFLLESEIFIRIYDELKAGIKQQYINFFRLMKYTIIEEDEMIEKNFIRIILNDILSTEEYNLAGIANYTGIHEDIIQELASGINTTPLASYVRKIIEIHRSVRRELYEAIGKKIIAEYLKN